MPISRGASSLHGRIRSSGVSVSNTRPVSIAGSTGLGR
jgi:hypothetical protein